MPPEFLDVVWRYIAAAAAIADSPDKLPSYFPGARLRAYIGKSSFLLKELFFYANRFARGTEPGLEFGFRILEEQIEYLPERELTKVAVRLTRLSTLRDATEAEAVRSRLAYVLRRYPEIQNWCEEEKKRCHFVQDSGCPGV